MVVVPCVPSGAAQVTLEYTIAAYAGVAISRGNKALVVSTDSAANRRSFFIVVSLP